MITLGSLFSPYAWILIILAALIIFGPRKLPELGRGLGRTINEFRRGLKSGDEAKKE